MYKNLERRTSRVWQVVRKSMEVRTSSRIKGARFEKSSSIETLEFQPSSRNPGSLKKFKFEAVRGPYFTQSNFKSSRRGSRIPDRVQLKRISNSLISIDPGASPGCGEYFRYPRIAYARFSPAEFHRHVLRSKRTAAGTRRHSKAQSCRSRNDSTSIRAKYDYNDGGEK